MNTHHAPLITHVFSFVLGVGEYKARVLKVMGTYPELQHTKLCAPVREKREMKWKKEERKYCAWSTETIWRIREDFLVKVSGELSLNDK